MLGWPWIREIHVDDAVTRDATIGRGGLRWISDTAPRPRLLTAALVLEFAAVASLVAYAMAIGGWRAVLALLALLAIPLVLDVGCWVMSLQLLALRAAVAFAIAIAYGLPLRQWNAITTANAVDLAVVLVQALVGVACVPAFLAARRAALTRRVPVGSGRFASEPRRVTKFRMPFVERIVPGGIDIPDAPAFGTPRSRLVTSTPRRPWLLTLGVGADFLGLAIFETVVLAKAGPVGLVAIPLLLVPLAVDIGCWVMATPMLLIRAALAIAMGIAVMPSTPGRLALTPQTIAGFSGAALQFVVLVGCALALVEVYRAAHTLRRPLARDERED